MPTHYESQLWKQNNETHLCTCETRTVKYRHVIGVEVDL